MNYNYCRGGPSENVAGGKERTKKLIINFVFRLPLTGENGEYSLVLHCSNWYLYIIYNWIISICDRI